MQTFAKKIILYPQLIGANLAKKTPVICVGDSWFNLTFVNLFKYDTVDWLDHMGFNVVDAAMPGNTIKKERPRGLAKHCVDRIKRDRLILAVSLSGNDILAFNPSKLMQDPASVVLKYVVELEGYLDEINKYCLQKGKKADIVFHGYDYLSPSTETFGWEGSLTSRFKDIASDGDVKKLLDQMIDLLNVKLIEVASRYENLHHVDLRGTVGSLFKEDIHPNKEGYRKVAEKIGIKLAILGA